MLHKYAVKQAYIEGATDGRVALMSGEDWSVEDRWLASFAFASIEKPAAVEGQGEALAELRAYLLARQYADEDACVDLDDAHPILTVGALRTVAAALAPAPGREVWRHVKRGTTYEVIGLAKLQNAHDAVLHDNHVMVIYQGDDGQLWAREQNEFKDGRFEPVQSTAGEEGGRDG
jgi:hypothetical protein